MCIRDRSTGVHGLKMDEFADVAAETILAAGNGKSDFRSAIERVMAEVQTLSAQHAESPAELPARVDLVHEVPAEQAPLAHQELSRLYHKLAEIETTVFGKVEAFRVDALLWDGISGLREQHQAAMTGDSDALEALLADGVSIDIKDSQGLTPLHWAVLSGDEGTVRVLCEAGAEVNAGTNSFGVTPMHIAAGLCIPGMIQLLAMAGGSTEALMGRLEMNPVQLALQSGDHETLSSALEARAGQVVDKRSEEQRLLLMSYTGISAEEYPQYSLRSMSVEGA
eukprot:TRINITY_DN17248_c0_g1_i1.p1 TRINITY_DN17248_c0_g1~~TRINITY_DN17248_c0_g1_i1.p1  ORF type:complete len:281 (-),score=75.90 TRINITY_DN17248_c0_g1_i1:300-1142(-)